MLSWVSWRRLLPPAAAQLVCGGERHVLQIADGNAINTSQQPFFVESPSDDADCSGATLVQSHRTEDTIIDCPMIRYCCRLDPILCISQQFAIGFNFCFVFPHVYRGVVATSNAVESTHLTRITKAYNIVSPKCARSMMFLQTTDYLCYKNACFKTSIPIESNSRAASVERKGLLSSLLKCLLYGSTTTSFKLMAGRIMLSHHHPTAR